MVVPDDVRKRWPLRDCVGGKQPGHDRSLHTSHIQAAAGPIARDGEVVVGAIEGRNSKLGAPGQRLAVAVAGANVGSPELRGEAGPVDGALTLRPGRALQRVPPEFAVRSMRRSEEHTSEL